MTREALTVATTSAIVGSGASLVVGWLLVRRRRLAGHRRAMLTATVLAGIFLVLYVTRWSLYGSKPFAGDDFARGIYLANLLPHVLLATAVGPLALRMIVLARREDFVRHRRLGRITVPIWLYVSASGWAVYFMLYHLYP